jgi:hypothetical protein
MVKSEMPKILEQMAIEARKKAMAEGLAKIEVGCFPGVYGMGYPWE